MQTNHSKSITSGTFGSHFRLSLQSVNQNGHHGVIAMLTVDQDFESVGGYVSAKLRTKKSNAKQMFNAFNAPGQNGHPAVLRVVAVNKHVIKNVLGELKVKDLHLLIITNLSRIVRITFIDFIPLKTCGGGIYHMTRVIRAFSNSVFGIFKSM